MKDKIFEDLLAQMKEREIPTSSDSSRKESIQAALKEFVALDQTNTENVKSSQENESSARPMVERAPKAANSWLNKTTTFLWDLIMNPQNNKMTYSALGSVAIAFVAVSLVFVMPSMRTVTDSDTIGRSVNENQTVTTTEVRRVDGGEPDGKRSEIPLQSEALIGTLDEKNEPVSKVQPKTENKLSDDSRIPSLAKADLAKPDLAQPADTDASSASLPMKEADQSLSNISAPAPMVAELESQSDSVASNEMAALASPPAQKGKGLSRQRAMVKKGGANKPTFYPALPEAESIAESNLDQGEEYSEYKTNPIKLVSEEPVSTFSIDVDTASYSLVRNQLNNGYLPKPQAVRPEEFINYFNYGYTSPKSKRTPFATNLTVSDSPWNNGRKLVHIGIKGYELDKGTMPDSNLVFLLDVSGSMNAANKLPLVKQSISLLLDTLKPSDTVSIVVYAGAAGTVLEPTKASEKTKIMQALQNLSAGGSTAGGAGISLAYRLAEQNFDKDAVNRIILATDGDFNVGQSSNEDLKTLVERKRESGVMLSVLGFGRNNYQDDMMQTLAQNGNGVAAYIDSLSEARKVLVTEASSNLFTIAKDVKIQVEFNPATVSEYRLVGYETRALKREDFNNDKVDAGDIGAGHTVTAIYEITPAGSGSGAVDEPRYAENKDKPSRANNDSEYGYIKLRYKLPKESKSKLIEQVISKQSKGVNSDVKFSIAVAGFAQLLSGSNNVGSLNFDNILSDAIANKGSDPYGYRSEFIQLVRMAKIAQ